VRAVAKDISVRLDIDSDCHVRGDADRLQQVFWNLLSNAVKFTASGGAIHVNAHRHGSHLDVEVVDTGAGIDPEFLPFVFDRFRQADQSSTRRHGGLGLGLALVKHLVELHGGTVDVTSGGQGHGATFRVRLPAATNGQASRPGDGVVESHAHDPSLRGRTILVVDDDLSTLEVVTAVLNGAGARVVAGGSAADGVRALEVGLPDAIIADLGMPGEDGFSFIAGVRRLNSPTQWVPALALSAYADPASQKAALDAGFTAFLAKPAKPHDLLRAVDRLLRQTSAS
jgi:CheY-like chemotaxis protein